MSGWLGDFLRAYKQHPISAVMLLAALISACAVVGVAYAIRYDSPVPVQTVVTRPAQGQVPAGRPRPRGLPRPTSIVPAGIVPALPIDSTTTPNAPRTARASVPASSLAASPSASPTASPDALPTPTASGPTEPASPPTPPVSQPATTPSTVPATDTQTPSDPPS